MDIEYAIASLIFVGLTVTYSMEVTGHIFARKQLQFKLDKVTVDDQTRDKVKKCFICGDMALVCEILGLFLVFLLPQFGLGYKFTDDIYFCVLVMIAYVASEMVLSYVYRTINGSIRWHD